MMDTTQPLLSEPGEPKGDRAGAGFRIISIYGLLILLVLMFALFSILLPTTFPTVLNIRGILSDKSITALVALAEMVPISAGCFDMSVGYALGLYQILAIGMMVYWGVPWPIVIVVVLVIGAAVGLILGLLVSRIGIDPFIASLGVGTFLYGCSYWYAPVQIAGNMPPAYAALSGNPFGIPLPFVYVVLVSLALWFLFERLPVGRHLYMLGSNARAAELLGISKTLYVPLAFMLSGLITGLAGVVLGSKLLVASNTVGPSYLLPAFTGALLGSTTIRPGRVNVAGTLVAVMLLAVTVAGLQQLGAQFYVEPMFDGAMLVAAVGLAAIAARRRARVRAAAEEARWS